MAKQRIQIKLYAAGPGGMAGSLIRTSGGRIMVVKSAANPSKATLYARSGNAFASQSNSFALTYGAAEFYIDDSVDTTVDAHILCPGGQFIVASALSPGVHELTVDLNQKNQLYVIPYSYEDVLVDATEVDTGFDLPAVCQVLGRLSGCGLLIKDTDATETIDVGLGEAVPAESGGDANGFIAASAVSGTDDTLTIGTNGALFSTNAPHVSTAVAAKSITYTLTAGSDTAKGHILLPVVLA